jgi:hypothetical protein
MKKPIGRVYILTNIAMPNLIKIGFTMNTVENRVNELSSATGVPHPYEIEFQVECRDPEFIEKSVHKNLNNYRVNSNREFFKVSPILAAKEILSLIDEVIQVETRLNIQESLVISNELKSISNNQLLAEAHRITDWIEVPTMDWKSLVCIKTAIRNDEKITIWEMLSYRNRMKNYAHMSSLIKKIYFIKEKKYQILFKVNLSEQDAFGHVVSFEEKSDKLYDIFENHPFEVVFKYVTSKVV